MQKVLVTGGMGYIGSHTVVELIQAGLQPIIIDDLSNSRIDVLDGIERITGVRPAFFNFNLCNEVLLKNFFKENDDVKVVVHFAASKAVGESVKKPLLYYKNNLLPLMLLLQQLATREDSAILFSSSCTVYGQPDQLPVTEQSAFKEAESPYGSTKQVSEVILRDVCRANLKLRAISLRYFNPVGAHESIQIGELPNGTPNNLVPLMAQVAAGILPELKVFGSDYNTRDGSAIRDYIHVVDLARAHVKAVHRLLEDKQKSNYEFFNIGTGNGLSVLELIREFEHVNKLRLNYKIVDRRPGDVESIYADTSFTKQELAWESKLSVADMVQSTWKWQQALLTKNN
jgi:UDP-glucose 4-epimerase